MAAILLVAAGCDTHNDTQPELIDERQEMLKVMEFTAKAVSEITVSRDVRNEILGYAKEEFDGEVTAHFTKLLDVQNPNSSSSGFTGSFARIFQNKAIQFDQEQSQSRSQSAGDIQSSLEDYLKEHNMALFGPYLAENHANSSKPITVSFDPLDDDKISNVGYRFIPKTSQGSVANHGGLDAPFNIDNYYMEEIQNVDDQYAYENPTIFVIPDDGNTNIPYSSNNTGNTSNSTREINCEDLTSTAIIELVMPQFRLTDNLAWQPWERNIMNLWAISSDDIESFNQDGSGVLNNNTSQLWNWKQVSRSNARDKKWMVPGFSFLESNWKKDETELVIFVSYKERDSQPNNVEINFKAVRDTSTTTTVDIKTSIDIGAQFSVLSYQNFDRCSTLANFLKDRGYGTHEGRRIYSYGKLEFTLLPYED